MTLQNAMMMNRMMLALSVGSIALGVGAVEPLDKYVKIFAADDSDLTNAVPDATTLDIIEKNIPYFECPDKEIERAYYFRLWHLRVQGKEVEVLWDRTGEKYGRGKGLSLFVDGVRICR